MARYIDWRNQESAAVLEDRVHRLEIRVTALTDALRVLAHALENLQVTEREGSQVTRAARQAYGLLLAAEPPASPHQELPTGNAIAGDADRDSAGRAAGCGRHRHWIRAAPRRPDVSPHFVRDKSIFVVFRAQQ
jgi:hypothetical protein